MIASFSKTLLNYLPHPAEKWSWCPIRRVWMLNCSACSPDFSPAESMKFNMKHTQKKQQSKPGRLTSSNPISDKIPHHSDTIRLPELQQLGSPWPKWVCSSSFHQFKHFAWFSYVFFSSSLGVGGHGALICCCRMCLYQTGKCVGWEVSVLRSLFSSSERQKQSTSLLKSRQLILNQLKLTS